MGELIVITRVFIRIRPEEKSQRESCDSESRGWSDEGP